MRTRDSFTQIKTQTSRFDRVDATGVSVKCTSMIRASNETEFVKELKRLTRDMMSIKINQFSTSWANNLNGGCPLVTVHIQRESFCSLQSDPYGDYQNQQLHL